jgi:hypothetical protein
MGMLQNMLCSGWVYEETAVGGFEYWKLNFYNYSALKLRLRPITPGTS